MSKKTRRQTYSTQAAASRGSNFEPDYSITRRELRRIGILAGSFIAVLIILAIFQNQLLAIFIK